jgi:hypothetical protein
MKGKTCCYVHRYLEDLPAEIEVPVKKNVIKKTKECSLWGPPERTVSEDGTVHEVQYMKNLYTPLPLPGPSSTWSSDSDHDSEDESEPEDDSDDDPDYK